jgi:hypothetical protein
VTQSVRDAQIHGSVHQISTTGKYVIDATGAQIGAIGDHNVQTNIFGAPPRATDE